MMKTLTTTAACVAAVLAAPTSFQVANDRFELNGQEVTLMSGSFHYHRAHPSTWADRLARMAAMGLNTVQLYVPWNFHEVDRGVYDWGQIDPARNLSNFLSLTQQAGMLALVRAGPYICGEHDFGGFPARLLNISGLVLRANNTVYLNEVDLYWTSLMAVIKPHLVSNGGAVAMVQPENEFGSYGNTGGNPADADYIRHLKNFAYNALGGPSAVQLYTTDGGDTGYLSHGALPGEIFATGDGGPDIDPPSFWAAEDAYNPAGWRAHTDSEYYTGWLTHWGEAMANTSTLAVVSGISVILNYNGSFNLYMAYGGTNWGFNNGANGGGTTFQPVITSYDYNSPIAEGGTHGYSSDGDKFLAMKRVLAYWAPVKGRQPFAPGQAFPPEPAAPIATAYGSATLSFTVALLGNPPALQQQVLAALSNTGGSLTSAEPMTMEAMGQKHGYTLWTTPMPAAPGGQAAKLTFGLVADLAYVWCSASTGGPLTYVGSTYRPDGTYQLTVPGSCIPSSGAGSLTVLLANMGHVNYGHGIFDPKGLFPSGGPGNTGPVGTLGSSPLPGPWTAVPMDMYNRTVSALQPLYQPAPANGATGPAFYSGSITIPAGQPVTDTYLSVCGWGKGAMWINGNHIGRYWENKGPQHAFYVPAAMLTTGINTITVFEETAAPAGYAIKFVDGPDFTGAVCKAGQDVQPMPAILPAPVEAKPKSSVSKALRASASCPTVFSAGQAITIQDCTSAGASAAWTPVVVDQASYTVVLTLTANPSLCLSVNDTTQAPAVHTAKRPTRRDNSLGQAVQAAGLQPAEPSLRGASTNTVLAPCASGYSDRGQHFMYFQDIPANALMSVTRGNCLDVYGGGTAPGTTLEVYGCSGNSNQAWTFGSGGQITGRASGLCIAAC